MTTTEPTPLDLTVEAAQLPRPRIRTGAVIWGLMLVAIAAITLWTVTDPVRRAAAMDAVTALDGFGWTIVGVVTFGGILTLIALGAVIRQGQRRLARREPASL